MKTQHLLVAISISMLNIAAYGCGGDEGPKAQTGDTVAAGSGSEGSPLKPQAAAKSASDQCVASTTEVFEKRTDGYGPDCVKCVCNLSPQSVASCNEQADACWGALSCARESCADLSDADQANCVVEKCKQTKEAAELLATVRAFMEGNLCSAACKSK
jgi:hypothetical protein